MIWVIICGAFIFWCWEERNCWKKRSEERRQRNIRAYREFLENEPTMTEDEKVRASFKFTLFGEIAQPYSGRKFHLLP